MTHATREIWMHFLPCTIYLVRFLLGLISHSRHVLMPVSSMNFVHEWFLAFAEDAQCRKNGGRLYVTCRGEMLLKCSWLQKERKKKSHYDLLGVSIWGVETKLQQSIWCSIFFFSPPPSLFLHESCSTPSRDGMKNSALHAQEPCVLGLQQCSVIFSVFIFYFEQSVKAKFCHQVGCSPAGVDTTNICL